MMWRHVNVYRTTGHYKKFESFLYIYLFLFFIFIIRFKAHRGLGFYYIIYTVLQCNLPPPQNTLWGGLGPGIEPGTGDLEAETLTYLNSFILLLLLRGPDRFDWLSLQKRNTNFFICLLWDSGCKAYNYLWKLPIRIGSLIFLSKLLWNPSVDFTDFAGGRGLAFIFTDRGNEPFNLCQEVAGSPAS